MANTSVLIPGTGADAVDANTVNNGSGTVYRQVVTLGDPSAGGNEMAVDSNGSAQVKLYDAAGNALLVNSGDAAASTNLLAVAPLLYNGSTQDRLREVAGDAQAATGIAAVAPMCWNGATYDRLPDNMILLSSLASSARTAFTDAPQFNANGCKGIFVVLIIAAGSSPSLQILVVTAGATTNVAPLTTAVTATGTYGYIYYPGATQTANATAGYVNQSFQVAMAGAGVVAVDPGNGNSITYSLSVYGIP